LLEHLLTGSKLFIVFVESLLLHGQSLLLNLMVKQLLEQSLFLLGYLLVLVHVHLMVHLPSSSHTGIAALSAVVVHRERVGLSSRSALLGVLLSNKTFVSGLNGLSRSVHHLLVGVDVFQSSLGSLKLIVLLL
jgi:hypothetical protein